MSNQRGWGVLLGALLLAQIIGLTYSSECAAASEIKLSKKQSVYVPVYSNLISGPRKRPLHLEALLSIRSTDPSVPLRITAIDYYDSNGKLLRRYLKGPQVLGALASTQVHLEEKSSGGIGANFIVRWEADRIINVPLIECVMIGTTGGQGLSFVSQGQEIREDSP